MQRKTPALQHHCSSADSSIDTIFFSFQPFLEANVKIKANLKKNHDREKQHPCHAEVWKQRNLDLTQIICTM